MIILRNNRYRSATLVTGILLSVLVISNRNLFETPPESQLAPESVHLMGRSISRAMREASFFQPIIQFTARAHENRVGEKHRTLPVDEVMLYKRR